MSESTKRTLRTLEIQDIQNLLPHRYPILLVDRILDFEPGKWIRGMKNISIGDPVFMGHFPQKPIFPGVLIIEAMAQTGGCLMLHDMADRKNKLIYFMAIDKVKFRKPVVPGDQLVMDLEVISVKGRICKLRGVASVDNQKVAEAELMSMTMDIVEGDVQ
jgi:beta-hydroxyacyl-ACP dehydratase FabZ